jgi:hypothetical protein
VFSAGKITVDKLTTNRFNNRNLALSFSRGIDSTSVFIQNRSRKPELLTIIGGVIPVNNRTFVDKFKKHYTNFASIEEVKISFIETNIRDVINEGLLTGKFGKHTGYMPWWMLAHIIVQFSVCAPLTQTNKIRSLLFSGTITDCEGFPDREITDNFFFENKNRFRLWSDVDTIFTNLELSRQQEVKTIKNFIESNGYIKLQVCNFSPKYNQFNCGICDKCSYTITSLILEGLNPKKLGFPLEKNFSDSVKKHIFKGNIKGPYWKNIQNNIYEEKSKYNDESGKLFEWLRTQNFNSKKMSTQLQVMKYYLYILYAMLPKPIRKNINSIGSNILWNRRNNIIHLLSTS